MFWMGLWGYFRCSESIGNSFNMIWDVYRWPMTVLQQGPERGGIRSTLRYVNSWIWNLENLPMLTRVPWVAGESDCAEQRLYHIENCQEKIDGIFSFLILNIYFNIFNFSWETWSQKCVFSENRNSSQKSREIDEILKNECRAPSESLWDRREPFRGDNSTHIWPKFEVKRIWHRRAPPARRRADFG